MYFHASYTLSPAILHILPQHFTMVSLVIVLLALFCSVQWTQGQVTSDFRKCVNRKTFPCKLKNTHLKHSLEQKTIAKIINRERT
jgi:hypothetical protein